MNITLKKSFIILLGFMVIGCSYAKDQKTTAYPAKACEQAKLGQLNIENLKIDNPHINAYLLNCAVSVVISEVSFRSGSHKGSDKKKKKQRIADYLLAQDLDLAFQNEDGDNLLMAVITSFLSEPWKEKAVTTLLKNGIDPKAKNPQGDTALDIAKFKGNERIIKLVSY